MKNKLVGLLLLGVLCVPVFAAEQIDKSTAKEALVNTTEPGCSCERVVIPETRVARTSKPISDQMRAELKDLVMQYKKADEQQKQEIKTELAKHVMQVREQMIQKMEKRVASVGEIREREENVVIPAFNKDVARMQEKNKADRENMSVWVDEKTEQLITSNGDLEVLFAKPCSCARHHKMRVGKTDKKKAAQFNATKKKMAKLVKSYHKASGQKKVALKNEIRDEVQAIREEQIKRSEKRSEKMGQDLAQMKKKIQESRVEFAKFQNRMQEQIKADRENMSKWVDEKTAALIEKDGDLKVLFDRIDQGPQKGHMKGFKNGKGHKFGPKDGKGPRMGEGDPGRVGLNPPPPPPLEEK